MLRAIGCRGLFLALAATLQASGQNLAAVQVPGAHIQRTMSLLASSTAERRNRVRILFYGQSITGQDWWKEVADDLRARYPHADLDIQNRAIGGFAAPSLLHTAEYDLYPFYPDLLIFHVYAGGRLDLLEAIVRRTRQRTAAEILLWTHHWIGRASDQAESARIRAIAVRYDCGLVDVMPKWQAALLERRIVYKDLLEDGIHLNEDGRALLASMLKPFLVRAPGQATPQSRDLSRDLPVDGPAVKRLADGRLEVTFTGNRIDAIASPAADDSPMAVVTVDGKPPAQFEGAFALTRPSHAPHVWFPAVVSIGHRAPLIPETWTIRFFDCSRNGTTFRYSVSGSVTGPDGEGSRGATFVSNSGRVVLDAATNWGQMASSLRQLKKEMPDPFEASWEVVPLFAEKLQFAPLEDRAKERTTTLVQGIPNGPHTVCLTPLGGVPLHLAGFRIYRPPIPETE